MKNDITKLKTHLTKAMTICNNNITKAHNIDLENLAQLLDSYVDTLNEIGDFETYEDEPEYDSAGFTEEDRIVDGKYKVIGNIKIEDGYNSDDDTHHCDDLDCNC